MGTGDIGLGSMSFLHSMFYCGFANSFNDGGDNDNPRDVKTNFWCIVFISLLIITITIVLIC
jgi:hypothetical protein